MISKWLVGPETGFWGYSLMVRGQGFGGTL
uniref:Uncharacterized protein n=1 Tax=Anguilla anguilla TaxID=7936 RepID=A0A0E9U8P8_ANGAN